MSSPFDIESPFVVAHRGDSAYFPENTLLAIESAMAKGADGIEMDVRISIDGVPYLLHDRTVGRTLRLGGSKIYDAALFNIDSSYIDRLDAGYWFDPDMRTPIPTLGDALDLIASSEAIPFIDLRDPAALPVVIRNLKEAGLFHRSVVMCRDLDSVEAVKNESKYAKTAAVVMTPLGVDLARKSHLVDGILAWKRLASSNCCRDTRKAGKFFGAWTLDPGQARKIVSMGADIVITDDPAGAIKAIQS